MGLVARFFGVEGKRLSGKRTGLRDQRALAMKLIYRHGEIGQVEIGRLTGGGLYRGESGAQAVTGEAGARCQPAQGYGANRSSANVKRKDLTPDMRATIYELMDQYKTPDVSRRAAQVILSGPEFGYPMVALPAIPGEQLKILRAAYLKVLKDVDFLGEIKKLRLELNASSAEELKIFAEEVVGQPADVVERVRKLLKD